MSASTSAFRVPLPAARFRRPSSSVIMAAAAWPQANRTAKMVFTARGYCRGGVGRGGEGTRLPPGGIQHDFWYCVSIKIFIRSLESKLMRAAYANLCGCLSNRSGSSTSLFYSCPCHVHPLACPCPSTFPACLSLCRTRHGMSFGGDRFYLMTWH